MKLQKQYLNDLVDPSFLGGNKLFILSFEDNGHPTRHARYSFSNCRNKRLQFYD